MQQIMVHMLFMAQCVAGHAPGVQRLIEGPQLNASGLLRRLCKTDPDT